MTVTIRVIGSLAHISDAPQGALEECLSVYDPKRFFNRAFKEKRWDGKIRLYAGNSFPAGLTERVTKHLNETGREVRVIEERETEAIDLTRFSPEYLPGITLWPHQCEAVRVIMEHPRLCVKSPTACHRKGQKIRMYDGSLRAVEDVSVGDLLMGPDGLPRVVCVLHRGHTKEMFKVVPKKGEPFVVTGDHVLTLVRTNVHHYRGKRRDQLNGTVLDVSVYEWLQWSKTQKHIHKLFRVAVEFPRRGVPLFNPYLVGLMLGDGSFTGGRVALTTTEPILRDVAEAEARFYGLRLVPEYGKGTSVTWHFSGSGRMYENPLRMHFSDLGLIGCESGEKFVPDKYKYADRDDRLALLAGLLDTDGSLSCGGYDYVSKSARLAEDVVFLCRSVGLAAYIRPCMKQCQTGAVGLYYRVSISGRTEMVPCRLPRKCAHLRKMNKDVLRVGFCVERLVVSEPYYGFTLTGDGRYLLDDFIVTHNSGKTEVIAAVARLFWEERGWRTLIVVPRKGLAVQTAARLRKYYRDDLGVGVCGDGQRQLGTVTVCTAQTLVGYKTRIRKGADGRYASIPPDPLLKKLVQEYEVLLEDEVHHASSASWFDFAMASNARRRIGLSGTPLKQDEVADLRMIGATGPVKYTVSVGCVIEQGLVARPKICVVMSENASGPEMPSQTVTRVINGCERPVQVYPPYKEAYDAGVIHNRWHNTAVLRAVVWLVDRHKQTLVLCRRKDHWLELREALEDEGVQFAALWGATETSVREEAKKALDEGRIRVLLVNVIFDEGEDVPGIEALVLAEGVKVSTNAIQRIGRGLRKKKRGENVLWVVDFAPTCHPKLLEHAAERVTAYEGEGYEVRVLEEWPKPGQDVPRGKDLLPFVSWG